MAQGQRGRRAGGTTEMTTADLVVLSLLVERPMHGYDLLAAYRRQEVEDWASVSKAQLYYALKKLADGGFLKPETDPTRDRTVFSVTEAGSKALGAGLADPTWAQRRVPQPFATWLGLSIHAAPGDVSAMITARKEFLAQEILRETRSLEFIATLDSERARKGEAIVRLVIAQLKAELAWIEAESGSLFEERR